MIRFRNGWLLVRLLVLLILQGVAVSWAGAVESDYAQTDSKRCASCHQLGDHSPVDTMLASVHGPAQAGTPMNGKGCEQCHGSSAAHAESPTTIKPGVSFGPTWTDPVAQQNGVCLSCHEKNIAKHWREGRHGQENLTCVSCHDLHSTDTKMTAEKQLHACTQCHKVQKQGMHHLGKDLEKGLGCATCHNPHANPKPVVSLLQNRSEGCRTCHDLKAMQASVDVSEKAKIYHKAMARVDRTCIDCHRLAAHVAMDEITPPQTAAKNVVTLFAPGQANYDWIISDHPGAQPFRQGRNCSQCHGGEQAEMGKKLAPKRALSSVDARLDFAVLKQQQLLQVTVRWQGSVDDGSVALMLDDGSDQQFTHAGCWAACHNDLPGQEKNRGQAITKYLGAALKQQRSVGRYAIYHDDATLQGMLAEGHYVELWRAQLAGGKLTATRSYEVLSARSADDKPVISARASYANGEWTVVFSKPLQGSGKAIVSGREYTFGVAIHGAGDEKSAHWVSLPMTFGLNLSDVDFPIRVK